MKSTTLLNKAVENLKILHPDIYNWAFTKRTDPVHGYSTLKIAQLVYTSHLMAPDMVDIDSMWSIAAIKVKQYDWPFYHISDAFASAVHLTTPPDDLSLADLNLPFPSFAIALPINTSIKLFGCVVPLLYISCATDMEFIELPQPFRSLKRISSYTNEGMKLFVGGTCLSTEEQIPINYGAILDWTWNFKEYSDYQMTFSNPLEDIPFFDNVDITKEEERKLPEKIGLYGVKLLAILNSLGNSFGLEDKTKIKPKLVVGNKGFKYHYHPPLWIQAGYKNEEMVEPNKDNDGVKRRMHWRRGHIRRQHFGVVTEGKTRLIWIRPVLVNKNT
jgi:hypothetical protein